MAYRIEIGLKRGVPDARGCGLAARAASALNLKIGSVQTRTVYKLDAGLSRAELAQVRAAFTDPVTEQAALGRLRAPKFDWLIEIGFKPGVTDNVGRTARVALADVLARPLAEEEAVYTAQQYFVRGASGRRTTDDGHQTPDSEQESPVSSLQPTASRLLTRQQIEHLANDLLANPLIQTVLIFSPEEWQHSPVDLDVPAIHALVEPAVATYDLSGADADLERISREHILALSLDEMRAIRNYFTRPAVRAARQELGLQEQPTDVEVECVAQTWSEHCHHKVFSAKIHYVDQEGHAEWIESLFRTYIRGATEKIAPTLNWLVSVFTDNAGVIRFNERLNLVYKVETHNTPSALDPYGGAMTGIVGVNRDPLGTGMGANLLCNVWGYCLGSPFYAGKPARNGFRQSPDAGGLPEGLMHPRRIRDGVHQGVIEGGNQSGIPWMRGWELFDDRYIGKPLVFCGTVGYLPATLQGRPSERKEVKPGDAIIMLGGRIGKDGIHGATFSSEELRVESPAQAVQIGDPITQRKMYEFLMEARDLGLYRAITDNGAGGLSCSVGEMGRLSGGAEVDLARAPLKYQGLLPWEIFLSEAQERMTLAVAPEQVVAFVDLARRRDVEATVLGAFTNSGALVVRYGQRVVGRLDMDFLYEGCPIMTLEARWTPPNVPAPEPLRAGQRDSVLAELLGDLNLCSKEFKSRQYDGEVKGLSVVKPYVGVYCDVPSDATVMRVEYDRPEGVILAEGINPFYSDLDTYAMMAAVIDEAVRRIISAGGRLGQIAGLDNFCWCDPVQSEKTPDGHYKLAQLVRANKALYDVTTAFGVPCISGKDSVKNDSTRGGRIGRLDDVRKAVTMDMKQSGDLIYVIGLTRRELGASAFFRWLAARQNTPSHVGGVVPQVDIPQARALYQALHQAAEQGLLRSSHTPTRGGLAVALALSALGADAGVEVDLSKVPVENKLTDDELLFSESNSRFIVTVASEQAPALETLFQTLPCGRIGRVTADRVLRVKGLQGKSLITAALPSLRKAFKGTLNGI
ncbi:MAG: phosphoribosylformylglycinamidine synthase [Lentisphaerae bacterium]|nr:phosphoribosylformylglycinamidine synthase [Lentisphaerota bacterium]